MVVGFIIWSIVAIIFMIIGISAWKSKQEVGFFTFSKPPKVMILIIAIIIIYLKLRKNIDNSNRQILNLSVLR